MSNSDVSTAYLANSPLFDNHIVNHVFYDESRVTIRNLLKRSKKATDLGLDFLVEDFLDKETIRENFMMAPASSAISRHHCYSGGLLYHNWEVFTIMVRMLRSITGNNVSDWDVCKCLLVSMFHDLNKVCDTFGRTYYIDNILSKGTRSTKKPWKINPQAWKLPRDLEVEHAYVPAAIMVEDPYTEEELLASYFGENQNRVPDGVMSLLVLRSFSYSLSQRIHTAPDSQDIIQAIKYHDGGYGAGRYELSGSESTLTMIAHAADMISSRQPKGAVPEVLPLESIVTRSINE